jgi:flavin-dependent dehydrogenase/NAD-dependent dihydropyrimidine dehydrogenase PreA subunit
MHNQIDLQTERCDGCGRCVRTCPQFVFEKTDGKQMRVAHPDRCFGCLACEEDCPRGALTVHRMPTGMSRNDISAPGRGLDPERIYDLLIIGAGPAGLGAAMRARRLDLDVAVLERLPSPQRSHHPDGGLLFATPDISPVKDGPAGIHYERFDLTIPAALVRDRFCDFAFMGPGGLATITGHRKPVFPYVRKDDFVALLAARAQEQGVHIAWNTRVRAIRRNNASGVMSLSHDGGDDVRSRMVISAEGSTGRLAEKAGIPVNQRKVAWSYAAVTHSDAGAEPTDEVGFLVGAIAGAPSHVPFLSFWASGREHAEIATGPLQKNRARILERPLEDYLQDMGRHEMRIVSRMKNDHPFERRRFLDGCRILARRLPDTCVGDGIIAVGDAIATCGMCTTLAALRTGDLAAEVAAKAIRSRDTRKERLVSFDRQVFGLSMMQGMKWMHNLLIEAPLFLERSDLLALFEMLRHLDLTTLMAGRAFWPMVRFYGRNLFAMGRRRDLRRYLLP